ncbi:MAG: helix-turn-helix transcriptional regulator [Cyclobacteriaceae bacterium]
MIAQPRLGEILIDIRKEKGWTQEELVSESNVSVRTIQRIESGEVTPRYSTVKILLHALGYDMDEWARLSQKEASKNVEPSNFLSSMFTQTISKSQYSSTFNAAWIAGIIYTIFAIADIFLTEIFDDKMSYDTMLTLAGIKIVGGISIYIFYRGFVLLSDLFENSLVKAGSFLFTLSVIGMYVCDLALMALGIDNDTTLDIQGIIFLIALGASGIVFGIGMLKLQDGMGKLAKTIGVMELVVAACYMSIIMSFFGLILFVPVMILEIIFLIKAEELAREGKL